MARLHLASSMTFLCLLCAAHLGKAQDKPFAIVGEVINQRAPSEKYNAPNGVSYVLDGAEYKSTLTNSEFFRDFQPTESSAKIRVDVVISQPGRKLYSINRSEVTADEYFRGKSGARKINLGELPLGSWEEKIVTYQRTANGAVRSKKLQTANSILTEIESLLEEDERISGIMLAQVFIARGDIAVETKERDLALFRAQIDSLQRLLNSQAFASLPLNERYISLRPVFQVVASLPSKSKKGEYSEDQITARAVFVLRTILEEMVAYETTAPDDSTVGQTAGALQEYYQSRIHFGTFQVKAGMHRSSEEYSECMDTLEAYWKYSGIAQATDKVRDVNIVKKVRDVTERYIDCLWQSLDWSVYDFTSVDSIRSIPKLEEQLKFIGEILVSHKPDIKTKQQARRILEINKLLMKGI